MISRHAAEQQADQCLMYHAGLYALGIAGLALTGNRSTALVAEVWSLGLAAHAALLNGVPEAREKILMWTAEGMEERQRFQQQAAEKLSEMAEAVR